MSLPHDLPGGWPDGEPAFHAGEQALQARLGMAARMSDIGPRVIRTAMPAQHREFFEELPFMLLGALDDRRRPWATFMVGPPGFVRTPDARSLLIAGQPLGADRLSLALGPGAPVGLLGIEPATRRRNRVNGVVKVSQSGTLHIGVRQSFGNCPKYIQARSYGVVDTQPQPAMAFDGLLPAQARVLVQAADTFFIATASPDAGLLSQASSGGVDVSHRGGKPGFVQLSEEGGHSVLTVPDFAGNAFFNTLGNIEINPQAGLLFADWQTGDLLMFTGVARVVWDGPAVQRFAGAQRLLTLQVTGGRWLPGWMPLRAAEVDYAPQLAATGSWEAAADKQVNEAEGSSSSVPGNSRQPVFSGPFSP